MSTLNVKCAPKYPPADRGGFRMSRIIGASRLHLVAEDLESHIEWSNLIFLPFHPVFQLLVLFSVIVKTTLVSIF